MEDLRKSDGDGDASGGDDARRDPWLESAMIADRQLHVAIATRCGAIAWPMKSAATTPWSNAFARLSATATTSRSLAVRALRPSSRPWPPATTKPSLPAMSHHIDHMGGMIEGVVFAVFQSQ